MDLNDANLGLEDGEKATGPQKDSEMNNVEDNSANNSTEPQKDSEMNNVENNSAINSTEPQKDSEMNNVENNSAINSTEPQKDSEMNNVEDNSANNSDRTEVNETSKTEDFSPQTQAVSNDSENGNAEADVQNADNPQDCFKEDLENQDIPLACDTNSKPEDESTKNEILSEAIIKIAKPLCADYRSDSDSESVDSESDSSQSSSDTMTETSSESEDDSDESCNSITNNNSRQEDKKSKRELMLNDLPPIEDLRISVPEDDCVEVGTITSIVDTLVVVESYKGSAALDIDTVLFLESGKRTLGKVFDILGPIAEPVYAIRFNSQEQIKSLNIEKGLKVYYAPKTPHTTFVFMSEVLKNRGSDASWKDNAEAPPEFQDFSDDEEEWLHKQRHPRDTDGENSNPRDPNKSRKRPFTQFRQRNPQPNSFRNPNFQPTRRPNFQRYPPPNQFIPPHTYPRPNPFPFNSSTPYACPGGPVGPPYYPPRISGPPFPAFGAPPFVNQNFQQPFYQQRAHPQNFGAWGNLMFRPPPPPPPATEQGDHQPAAENQV